MARMGKAISLTRTVFLARERQIETLRSAIVLEGTWAKLIKNMLGGA